MTMSTLFVFKVASVSDPTPAFRVVWVRRFVTGAGERPPRVTHRSSHAPQPGFDLVCRTGMIVPTPGKHRVDTTTPGPDPSREDFSPMGKNKTLRDHASELAETLAPHVELARDKAAPLLADARDKAAPVLAEARLKAAPYVADARDKAAPLLADARDKAAPVLADARDKAAPYVADARDRLTTEVLPVVTAALASVDAATEEARAETLKRGKAVAAALRGEVEAPQKKHRGRLLLILLGIGGAVFAGIRVMGNRRATTNWQSSYTPPPAPATPSTTTTSSPAGGGLVAGSEGGLHRAEASPDDTAASDPAEAVSDATDVPHPSSTPDNPVTEVDVDRE